MKYIYQGRKIKIVWSIYKALTTFKEDFSRSDLRVWLRGTEFRYPVDYTIECGDIVISIDEPIKCDKYGIEAVCHKNDAGTYMKSFVPNVFGVTEYENEAESGIAPVGIKIKSQIASYGYDGLDAWELAILKGKTTLDEESWLESRNSNINDLNESITRQNVRIAKNAEDIADAKRASETAEVKTEQFGERVAENAGKISDIDAAVGVVDAKVTYLEEVIENEEKYHNKGVYRSEATLRNVCDNPETGDYCLLQEPYRYAIDAEMPDTASASMYWGEGYIGKKSDERFGYVYAGSIFFDDETSKSYYELTDNISAEAFAAHSIAELTTDHQAKNVLVRVINAAGGEKPKFYLQICEGEGEWTNTYKEMTFDVSNRVETKHVFEGSYTQEKINGVNQQNFIVVNNNNTRLQYVVNMLAKVVNNLQEKVAYLSDMAYENIPELNMVDLNASKTGSQYMLDFSPMEGDDVEYPFLLSR